jgi:hypothetical protein
MIARSTRFCAASSTTPSRLPPRRARISDAIADMPTAKLKSSRVLPVRLAVTNSTWPLKAK